MILVEPLNHKTIVNKIKFLTTICCFFISTVNFAQNKRDYKKTTDSLLKILKTEKKLDSFIKIAHDASVYYYKKADYEKAIFYSIKEVENGKKTQETNEYKKAIYNLGRFYYYNKEYYNAINTYNIVIDSFSIDIKTYQSYCEIGSNYLKLGDYYQALNYYKKGLQHPELFSSNSLYNKYINFAIINLNIETKESLNQQLLYLKKADSIKTKGNLLTYNGFATHFSNDITFNLDKSKYYYKKCLEIVLQQKDTFNIISTYNNLSWIYKKAKNDSTLYYLKTGLKLAKDDNSLKPLLLSNLAEYYTIKNANKESLSYLHKSLQLLTPNIIDSSYNSVPKLNDIILSQNKFLVLDNLKDKAENFNALNKYRIALENLKLADQLLDTIRNESTDTQSKLLWQKEASELYILAVKTSYLLNKPEEAFFFIEKNKAILLLENITKSNKEFKLNIPANILQKEYDLKQKINETENRLNSSKADKENVQKQYYSYKIEYNRFVENLKDSFPDYYRQKTPINIDALEHLKKTISKNKVVIEYILDNDEGYVLCITNDETKIYKLDEVNLLKDKLSKYLNLISKPFNNTRDLNNYTNSSKELCQLLLPMLKDVNLLKKKKLLIIPDYTLQNLPFESLKSNNKPLIEDFEISYAYSLSFLEKNKKLKRSANKPFIGFAPQTFNYDNLKALPQTNLEVQTIKKELNGVVLLDTSATKRNFFTEIKDYKIIHLSTHANANDSIAPWIAFKNEKLYLNELYTTKNKAELVILNACNSSLGEIKKGEGVFSLARGFFYSGANSVISSVWNVNDKSNAEITTSFYRYLKKGKTKSAALRQAKLDYINSHSLSEASPYYWSSLILIGDDSATYLNYNLLLYSALSVLLLIILFFLLKKIKFTGNKS